MCRDDFVIICGDFGGVWDGSKRDERNLDHLESLPLLDTAANGCPLSCQSLLLVGTGTTPLGRIRGGPPKFGAGQL